MAVRQHIYQLQDEKLVTFEEQPRPIGRPAKLWELTPAANQFFPNGHTELTLDLLQALRQTFGEPGIEKLLEARAKAQRRDYAATIKPRASLKKRVTALAARRSEEGYMAEVETLGRGHYRLLENHCPVCAAATVCQGLCAKELWLFQSVLGPDVSVERTDHILAGARRCA